MNATDAKVQSAGATPTTGNVSQWPTGETQVVFIIGDPVSQVKSPAFLTANLKTRGVNAVVVPGHVAAEDVDDFMRGVAATQNMPGLIFTVPHKQKALTLCDHVTERARIAGSVNVARRTVDGWIGDNTDGMGYLDGFAKEGGTPEGAAVLLVGAGGAGSAIAYEFLARGAIKLAIHDIDTVRRDALIARLDVVFPGKVGTGSNDPTGYDVIANATALGMRAGDPMPVDIDKLAAHQFAACPITKPDPSPFIAAAREKSCKTMAGIEMFKAQEGLLVDAILTLEKPQ